MTDLRELGLKIGLVLFIISIAPPLIQLFFYDFENDSTEEINNIISGLVIPWWIHPLEFLGNIGGQIGAILTTVFLGFLYWIGEMRGN